MLRDNGMCKYCLANGKYTKATVIDHFIALRDDYDKRMDMSNLFASCTACNTKKSYDEDKLRKNIITIEQFKLKWKVGE